MEDGPLVEDFVFEVEGDVVEAKGAEEFDGIGGVEADGGPEDHLALLEFGLGFVRSHGGLPRSVLGGGDVTMSQVL